MPALVYSSQKKKKAWQLILLTWFKSSFTALVLPFFFCNGFLPSWRSCRLDFFFKKNVLCQVPVWYQERLSAAKISDPACAYAFPPLSPYRCRRAIKESRPFIIPRSSVAASYAKHRKTPVLQKINKSRKDLFLVIISHPLYYIYI